MCAIILKIVLIISTINVSTAWRHGRTCCSQSKPVDASKIIFKIYNVGNPNGKIITNYTMPENISETIFITHGEQDNENNTYWIQTTTSEYITLFPEADIIHVEWYYYTKNRNYFEIVCYVPGVAKIVGDFAMNITRYENIFGVGFSLGSQITGLAGQQYFQRTGYKFGKIAALDPSAPCFSHAKRNKRLSSDDSERLWVVHTSKFGIAQPIGRADFYVNGGRSQPFCNTGNEMQQLNCSHYYAVKYLNYVIGPYYFPAYPCPNLSRNYDFEHSVNPKDCSPVSTFNVTVPTDNSTTGIFYVKSIYP